MKIKTSKLEGTALDWAVAKCEYSTNDWENKDYLAVATTWKYSKEWGNAGPIIERLLVNGYSISCSPLGSVFVMRRLGEIEATGETPLVAAMRCYVASKYGEEVEVPSELLTA